MRIVRDDVALFFRLMFELQYFVNQEYKILPKSVLVDDYATLPSEAKMPVRARLWEDKSIIDRYVSRNPYALSQEHLEIVRGWKLAVVGQFFIERYLKKHAIFIQDNDDVYAVLGLYDEIDQVIHPGYLPALVNTALLPFKGQIIYDGILETYSMFFGGGYKANLRETYLAAKQNRNIITSLNEPGYAVVEDEPAIMDLPDHGPAIAQMQKLARTLKANQDAPAAWASSFSLVRAALDMAERAVQNPDDVDALWDGLGKVNKAAKKLDTVLRRVER